MTLTERINENGDENNEPNDLTALLELARGVSFEDVENIVRDKDEFEKIESFFDLVKQNEADRNHDLNIVSNEANQNDNSDNDECETSEQVDDVQLLPGKHLSNDIQKDDTSVSDMEHEGGANNLSDHDSTSIYTSNLDDASDSRGNPYSEVPKVSVSVFPQKSATNVYSSSPIHMAGSVSGST